MAVNSADKKPEKYIGPDGKPKIRMVPVDRDVVKNEAANASKEAQRHMQGMKDARADMRVAKSADAMTKAMNKLQHHTRAHKKAMAAMEGYSPDLDPDVQKKKMITKSDKAKLAKLSDLMKKANEAKDGDGVNIVKDRPFKGKPMKKEPDSGKGISFANMKKSKWAKDADANPNRAKAMGEAKDPARTVSQLAIRDTNRRFDRATKSAEKDDENSKYRTSKSGNVFVGLKKEAKDPEEYDKEGDMAKTQLKTMIDAAQELHDQLSDDENMPEWVQNKITKATDYIDSVRDYMKNNDDVNEAIDMSKVGTKATIMHPITRVSKKVDKKDLTKYIDKGWKHMGPKKQRVTWGTKKEETVKERELTPGEMKKREKYAQDLPDAEFKKRYGDRWKSVKIATATKMAKGEK